MALLSIVTSNDDVILDNNAKLWREHGWTGWGKPDRANFENEGASDGFTHRGHRVTKRRITMPLTIIGDNVLDVQGTLERIFAAVDEPFSFKATLDDGSVYTIPARYVSGFEGDSALHTWARFSGVFECPDPFWTSSVPQQVGWEFNAGEPFLERRVLSAASLSGDKQVENLGTVASKPNWVLEGPFTEISASIGGVGFTYTGAVLAGQVLRITPVGDAWIVELDGVNVFENTAWGSRFPVLQRGESTVSLSLTGADEGTKVSMFWADRREVIF